MLYLLVDKVTIPTTVKKIGHAAFEGCAKLKTMRIPSSVKEIGYHAVGFKNGSAITDFKIYGVFNTEAEKYAKANSIKFVGDLLNTSKVSATTITKGKTVAVTCAAKGGAGSYTYKVEYKKSTQTK